MSYCIEEIYVLYNIQINAKKKVVNKKKKVENDEQKYICDACKHQIILGKNVKVKNEELTCRHKMKENLTLFFD